jgi:hypothetical protein
LGLDLTNVRRSLSFDGGMTGKLAALAVTIEKARCYAMRWRLARRVPVSTNNSIEGPLLFYFVPPARYARWSLRLLEIKVGVENRRCGQQQDQSRRSLSALRPSARNSCHSWGTKGPLSSAPTPKSALRPKAEFGYRARASLRGPEHAWNHGCRCLSLLDWRGNFSRARQNLTGRRPCAVAF